MNTSELVSKILRARYQQVCPECGGKMVESDRTCENGIFFVWYKCSDKDCQGQWLQKTSSQPSAIDVAVNQIAL